MSEVSETSDTPARPMSVPEGAIWDSDRSCWELAELNGGQKHGESRQWRPDGTLYMRARFEAGLQSGPFAIFHPNGQTAREGRFEAGEIEGAVIAYASDAGTPENLRSCCVPPNAWQMRARYEAGNLRGEVFFDREGRQLLSDGTLRPARPASVPDGAEFEDWTRRWAHGTYDRASGQFVGTWRYYREDGSLDEENEYEDGKKVAVRHFYDGGQVREEMHLVSDGIKHGPYRRRFIAAGDSPYADPRVHEERGRFFHGQLVGAWQFLDGDGQVLRTLERGSAYRAEDAGTWAADVLADQDRDAATWTGLAESLRAEGRTREALCAAARAAGRSGDTATLREFAAMCTIELAPEAGARLLASLGESTDETPAAALDALVGGAELAAVLRMLASLIKGAVRPARDLVEAAIALAPERSMTYLTRALVRIEFGDPEGARADAERVAGESEDTAQFLRDYVRLLFPEWTFWPGRETPESALDNLPDTPAQPLPSLLHAIALYATRLNQIRAAVEQLLPRAPNPRPHWLPPDLSALLPEGPVALESYTATIMDETDAGPENTEVTIDETVAVAGAGLPALMRAARANWTALSWLCWTAGLERVALPDTLSPPMEFPLAAGMSISRCWRAQDALATGGLRSMTAGVPGFVWEGLDIETMPKHLAQMAAEEYLEMRSVFLWLTSADNVSPFQSDLRQA